MVLSMSRKKVFLLLVSLAIIMSLCANVVFAQNQNFYDKFHVYVDAAIYFLFFLGIAQFTLGRHFEGAGGRAVVIAVALGLTVGIIRWAEENDFMLGNLISTSAWRNFLYALAILAFLLLLWFLFRRRRGAPAPTLPTPTPPGPTYPGPTPPTSTGGGAPSATGGTATSYGSGATATVGNITINVPGPGVAAPARARRGKNSNAPTMTDSILFFISLLFSVFPVSKQ